MYISKYAKAYRTAKHVYLYHAILGNALRIKGDIERYVRLNAVTDRVEGVSSTIPEALKNKFLKNSLLLRERDADLKRIRSDIREKEERASNGSLLGSLRFTMTYNCNCSCKYCYIDGRSNGKALDFDTAKKAIHELLDVSQEKKDIHVRFFGGEPTLYWNTIVHIVDYCRTIDRNFNFFLNTNGQRFTREMCEFLAENNIDVAISLDGIAELNDQQRITRVGKSYFENAKNTIALMASTGVNFVVSAVLTELNIDRSKEFIDALRGMGLKKAGFNIAKMVGSSILKYDETLADRIFELYMYAKQQDFQLSGYWALPYQRFVKGSHLAFCGGIGHEIDIRPDGKYYSCVGSNTPLGALGELQSIVKSEDYSKLCQRLVTNLPDCEGCDIEGLCAGECACDAEYHTGNFYGKNRSLCRFTRRITKLLIEEELS